MPNRCLKPCLLVLLLAILPSFSRSDRTSVRAQEQSPKARPIERLSGLCKLWGTIKFFHPYLAYKEIDWVLALIHTIPEVEAAVSAEDYRTAITRMLANLQDPLTTTGTPPPVSIPPPTAVSLAKPVTVSERVEDAQVISAAALLQQIFPSPQAEQAFLSSLDKESEQTPLRILDCRRILNGSDSNRLMRFVRYAALSGVSTPVPLGTWRHRYHSGYTTQTGFSSGGYYSALIQETKEAAVSPNPAGKPRPTAIMIDRTTPSELLTLLSGLQGRGVAVIVGDGGESPDERG